MHGPDRHPEPQITLLRNGEAAGSSTTSSTSYDLYVLKAPCRGPSSSGPRRQDTALMTTLIPDATSVLRHEDLPRNKPGRFAACCQDTPWNRERRLTTTRVDNDDEMSMGAVLQDCPTGSTVMTEMGAGEIVPDTLSCELKRSRGRAPPTDLDRPCRHTRAEPPRT